MESNLDLLPYDNELIPSQQSSVVRINNGRSFGMFNSKSYHDSLQILALSLSNKKTKIKFNQGVEYPVARRINSDIHLEMPIMKIHSNTDAEIAKGLLVSETSKTKFSRDIIRRPKSKDVLYDTIESIVDDYRRERLMIREYGGSKSCLRELNLKAINHTQNLLPDNTNRLSADLMHFILLYMKNNMYSIGATKMISLKNEIEAQGYNLNALLQKLNNYMESDLTSTARESCSNLLYQELKKIFEQDDKQDKKESSQNSKSGNENEPDSGMTLLEMLSGINPNNSIIDGHGLEMENGADADYWLSDSSSVGKEPRDNYTLYDLDTNSLMKHTNKMYRNLINLIESDTLSREFISKRGKINTRKLHKVVENDEYIFLNKNIKKKHKTHISILLDSSGSMGNHRMDTACKSCYIIARAIERVGQATSSVIAFSHSEDGLSYVKKPTQIVTKKMGIKSSGGTDYVPALVKALQECQSSTADRKAIIVVTDGEPDDTDESLNLIGAITKNFGIEVYFIGIQGFSKNYKNALDKIKIPVESIKDIEALPSAMFKILEKTYRR